MKKKTEPGDSIKDNYVLTVGKLMNWYQKSVSGKEKHL